MDLVELRARIDRWENLHTEFKAGPIRPDDLAASLVAFANTDGGDLIFGVSEQREVVGVEDADRVARDVDNVAANNCEPPITVLQETVRSEDGRTALVVRIAKGDMRPYRTSRGVFYVRTSSGRRPSFTRGAPPPLSSDAEPLL
jgi:ATP-dependent DNA helicase RecG